MSEKLFFFKASNSFCTLTGLLTLSSKSGLLSLLKKRLEGFVEEGKAVLL